MASLKNSVKRREHKERSQTYVSAGATPPGTGGTYCPLCYMNHIHNIQERACLIFCAWSCQRSRHTSLAHTTMQPERFADPIVKSMACLKRKKITRSGQKTFRGSNARSRCADCHCRMFQRVHARVVVLMPVSREARSHPEQKSPKVAVWMCSNFKTKLPNGTQMSSTLQWKTQPQKMVCTLPGKSACCRSCETRALVLSEDTRYMQQSSCVAGTVKQLLTLMLNR